METLRDFLLERIQEEETMAQAAIDAHHIHHDWSAFASVDGEAAHVARWNPWRVLTTCVGRRLLIAAHRDAGAGVDRRADSDRMVKEHVCSTCGQYDEYAIEWPCYTLRVLALDWVDHPAYRQEWRPRRLSSGVGRVPPRQLASSVPIPPQAPPVAALPEPAVPRGPAARTEKKAEQAG